MKKHPYAAMACLFSLLFVGLAVAAEKSDKPAEKAASAEKAAKKPEKPVDINNATEKELTTLPGVGPKIAKEIVAARPFQSVDDLKKVKGIGDKTFSMMKAHVVCNPVKK
jgi:competence ComEA-like helix-hairpin-helix protein